MTPPQPLPEPTPPDDQVDTERAFPSIRGQLGLATLSQLHGAGWTPGAARHARSTVWQEVMPKVVAPHRGTVDSATRSVAAWLWAGRRAVLTGLTALAWHGVRTTPRGYTFVVPATSRPKQHGHSKTVRSWRPVERIRKFGIVPTACGARAVVGAAIYEKHRPGELEALAIAILQQGLATPDELAAELFTRPLSRVEEIWKGLEAFSKGAWSMPEKAVREVIEGAGGFPELITNCTLETLSGQLVGTPDGYLRAASTVIQVQSRQYHQGVDDRGGDRWARTVEKDSDYTAVGLRVVGVVPWTVYQHPGRFIDKLRKVVEIGLAGPPAKVRIRDDPSSAPGA